MSISTSQITQGLDPVYLGVGRTLSWSAMITDGIPIAPWTPVIPTPTDAAMSMTSLVPSPSLPPDILATLRDRSIVRDVLGRPVTAGPLSTIDLGQGAVLYFDSTSLDARANPYLEPTSTGGNHLYDDAGHSMFTASDCRVMVEIPQTPAFNTSTVAGRVAKQVLELTTISVSIHRSKSPVRAFGYANPKGFARGSRTIAGTMVMSKLTAEVLYTFLQSELMADLTQDTVYTKLDQIPPIDVTLLFSNELGYVSTQRLLGVEFVTDGSVVSVQDALMEQQISWMASDFTPMVPLNFDTFFGVNTGGQNPATKRRIPTDIIKRQNRNILTDSPMPSNPQFNPPTTGSV